MSIESKKDWREVFLQGALIAGLLLAGGTELLSAFHGLTREGVFLFWVLAAGVCFLRLLLRQNFRGIDLNLGGFQRWEMAMLVILAVLAVALWVQGFLSAPNTFDSMVYHLSRVMHWAQAKSIEFYPTSIRRQLWMPPLAEYGVLHLYLLTGSDRLAFLMQWGAYIGCMFTASLIAGILGVDRRGQVAAAAMAAALPMAVLQGVSTQTDLVAAFWGMQAVAWFLLWLRRGFPWFEAVCGAAALALGVLTKMSVLVVCPLIAGVVILSMRALCFRRIIGLLLMIMAVVGVVNSAHFARVYGYFHTCNPAATEDRLTREDHGLAAFMAVGIRNAALNWTTSSDRVNGLIRTGVDRACRWLGVDANDPRFNLAPGDVYLKKVHVFYESRAPGGLHFWLGVFVLALVLIRWRSFGVIVTVYVLALVVGFVLLCILMKWQPWGMRFQLPLFLLGVPLLALVAARLDARGRLIKMLAGLFVFLVIPVVVFNSMHPWVGGNAFYVLPREDQYFLSAPEKKIFFTKVVDEIVRAQCFSVGLAWQGAESWEYPLWAMLRARGMRVVVRDVKAADGLPVDAAVFKPCLVIGHEGVLP
ncbi:MAG: hypothetical protein V2A70_08055 [Candidatus Omnitrophota bacterium]